MTTVGIPHLLERVSLLRALTEALAKREDEMIEAIVEDGWPAPMARAGVAMHFGHTWKLDALVAALDDELGGGGGLAALDTFHHGRRLVAPATIGHLWPALPGAGVTPTLVGALLGASQVIKPSQRGASFGLFFSNVWQEVTGGALSLEVAASGALDGSWRALDRVLISGSDETIAEVTRWLGESTGRSRRRVMGYGHRVSFGVVVDDETPQTITSAAALATDVVMWRQLGCFSARAVIFCGSEARAQEFAAHLATEIHRAVTTLGARALTVEELAERAQARGVAEFTGELFGEESAPGWVHKTSEPWRGQAPSVMSVTLHRLDTIEALDHTVEVPAHQLQGACLFHGGRGAPRRQWCDVLARLGVTRICAPGRLQAPPPTWWHDGMPNALIWARACSVDANV